MFNPKEFLVLAQNLIKNNPNECCIRTSIGRSYYATFLYLREWLKINTGCGFTDSHEDHKIVQDSVFNLDGRAMSDKLSALRRHRGKADYELSTIGIDKANNALSLAKYLIQKYP